MPSKKMINCRTHCLLQGSLLVFFMRIVLPKEVISLSVKIDFEIHILLCLSRILRSGSRYCGSDLLIH
jgi:hypothetical protein